MSNYSLVGLQHFMEGNFIFAKENFKKNNDVLHEKLLDHYLIIEKLVFGKLSQKSQGTEKVFCFDSLTDSERIQLSTTLQKHAKFMVRSSGEPDPFLFVGNAISTQYGSNTRFLYKSLVRAANSTNNYVANDLKTICFGWIAYAHARLKLFQYFNEKNVEWYLKSGHYFPRTRVGFWGDSQLKEELKYLLELGVASCKDQKNYLERVLYLALTNLKLAADNLLKIPEVLKFIDVSDSLSNHILYQMFIAHLLNKPDSVNRKRAQELIATRLPNDLEIKTYPNVHASKLQNTGSFITLFKAGEILVNVQSIIDGGQVNYTSKTSYPSFSFLNTEDALVLDERGAIIIGEELIIENSAVYPWIINSSILNSDLLEPFVNGVSIIHQNHLETTTVMRSQIRKVILKEKSILISDSIPTLNNHAHWLLDGLTRVVVMTKCLGEQYDICFLGKLDKYRIDSLKYFGIPEDRIHFLNLSKDNYPVSINKAIIPISIERSQFEKNTSINVQPDSIKTLKAIINSKKLNNNTSIKRVFITRSADFSRSSSHEEIKFLLNLYQIKIIENIEKMSFEEQLSLFSGLEIMIAPHGAGLSNMIFMQESSVVISFTNERLSSPFYPYLANIVGVRYFDIAGMPDHPSEPLLSQSFGINISDLHRILEETFPMNKVK